MRSTINALSDRLLSQFVPKAKAGACACGPWDNGWYYYCYNDGSGPHRWATYCTFNCNCNQVCTQQHNTWQQCEGSF